MVSWGAGISKKPIGYRSTSKYVTYFYNKKITHTHTSTSVGSIAQYTLNNTVTTRDGSDNVLTIFVCFSEVIA